jgi:glucan phosphorylase
MGCPSAIYTIESTSFEERETSMSNAMVALPNIAYFSMEIALESRIPTYSGGLGVLAGDTLRSAADMRLPMVGVTLLHRKGYFF